MSAIVNEVRKGFFLHSVALMRISRAVADCPGVEEAALMMGTPANKEIMTAAGLLTEVGETATGGDLVLGVRAASFGGRNLFGLVCRFYQTPIWH